MSLSKLPDLVKSQICSFLDFNEIKKLEQTNKRIQYFLRRYKLDRPKIHELIISYGDCLFNVTNDHVECSASFLVEDCEEIRLPSFEHSEDRHNHTPKILNLINKFNSINKLCVRKISLDEEAGWEHVSAKIKDAVFDNTRFICSKDLLIKFFKQCKAIRFFGGYINKSHIDDQLFTVLSDNGTTLHFTCLKDMEASITDVTLNTLSKKYLPKDICLQDLITDFTLGGIKKMVEAIPTSGMGCINWELGCLKIDKYDEVHRFVSEEFKDWADGLDKPLHLEHRLDEELKWHDDHDGYIIHHREKRDVCYWIAFSVKKPVKPIQRVSDDDSDDQTESDNENGVEDYDIFDEPMGNYVYGEEDLMDD